LKGKGGKKPAKEGGGKRTSAKRGSLERNPFEELNRLERKGKEDRNQRRVKKNDSNLEEKNSLSGGSEGAESQRNCSLGRGCETAGGAAGGQQVLSDLGEPNKRKNGEEALWNLGGEGKAQSKKGKLAS